MAILAGFFAGMVVTSVACRVIFFQPLVAHCASIHLTAMQEKDRADQAESVADELAGVIAAGADRVAAVLDSLRDHRGRDNFLVCVLGEGSAKRIRAAWERWERLPPDEREAHRATATPPA